MNSLLLGPVLRHVDHSSATIWVETAESGTVHVRAGDHRASAHTFTVHGHHYALVDLEGLPAGSVLPYTVAVDDDVLWPEPGSPYPPSVLATLDPERPLHLLYGSCRTSVPHDEQGNGTHGVDALRAFALHLAEHQDVRPDMIVFLGDQVYADETTQEMREFIESRRDIEQAPWTELKDYEEYAHLYLLAWTDPANRWLLSTVPSAMIFDDHDVRDDWNTSLSWKREMEQTSWWHGRIVAGLGSYWVYQHLGNLSPAERAKDPLWQLVTTYDGPGEVDLSDRLNEFADRADQDPDAYRWSFSRDFGDQARLIVVDSRAARVLEPENRALLTDSETAWLDEQMRGDREHLLVATSLPFLLAPGLHHVEAFGEALAGGAWGRRAAKLGETARQGVDLEHWGAFQRSFQRVSEMTLEVASGARGRAPRTITFLSGDVHHSYVSEARPPDARPGRCPTCRAGSSRRSARPSATRCHARCASPPRSSPTAWPARSDISSRAPPRCLTRRCVGGCWRARGSTTTSLLSRSPRTACGCAGAPAPSRRGRRSPRGWSRWSRWMSLGTTTEAH